MIVARGARRQRWRPIAPVENQHAQPHPRHDHRAGARHAGRSPCAPRRSRRHIAEALELVGLLAVEMFVTERRGAGQRAGAAAAQFRPLDDRRLRHQPVRAARARDLRPAAGLGRAPFRRGDEEPDRRRRRELARDPRPSPAPSCISTARPRRGPAARWATSRASRRSGSVLCFTQRARAQVSLRHFPLPALRGEGVHAPPAPSPTPRGEPHLRHCSRPTRQQAI